MKIVSLLLPADLKITVLRKTRHSPYLEKKLSFFLYTLRYVQNKPLVKSHKKLYFLFRKILKDPLTS